MKVTQGPTICLVLFWVSRGTSTSSLGPFASLGCSAARIADAHYNLGVALWLSGSRNEAISELERSIRLDPAAGAGHAFLGNALRDSGDLDGARQSLQRAIALLPPMPATYVDLAIIFLRLVISERLSDNSKAALNIRRRLLPCPTGMLRSQASAKRSAKTPDRADAHNIWASCSGERAPPASAVVAEFREAVRLRPDFAQAYNNIWLGFDPGR